VGDVEHLPRIRREGDPGEKREREKAKREVWKVLKGKTRVKWKGKRGIRTGGGPSI